MGRSSTPGGRSGSSGRARGPPSSDALWTFAPEARASREISEASCNFKFRVWADRSQPQEIDEARKIFEYIMDVLHDVHVVVYEFFFIFLVLRPHAGVSRSFSASPVSLSGSISHIESFVFQKRILFGFHEISFCII